MAPTGWDRYGAKVMEALEAEIVMKLGYAHPYENR